MYNIRRESNIGLSSCWSSVLFGDVVVFCGGRKPEEPEKNPRSKARTNNKLNPHMTPSRNRTRATLVGGERSHHYTIPAPHFSSSFSKSAIKCGDRERVYIAGASSEECSDSETM